MSLVLRLSAGVSLLLLCAAGPASAQTNVLTQHNDIGRTGQNLTETILTPASVSSGDFGLVGSLPIDGAAFAQPLYLSSLSIGGGNHSVAFVATEHDSVYAFDAGVNGEILWKASLFDAAHGAPAASPAVTGSCINANAPEFGAMGTPVIDPATNTLYVVAKTSENGSSVYRLHALDVTSGAEKFNGPTLIQASVAGTGSGSVNGQVIFSPDVQMQRPGLLLLNGTVYIGFGSMCDSGPFHGWVMGYNASTLAQTAAFLTTPNGGGSGVWLSGAGLSADNKNGVGRAFVPLGNGSYDATVPYGTNTMDYGNNILALNLSNGIKVTDAFTPVNQAALENGDIDVGSGGLIVLPDNMPGASVPHEAVHMGKSGELVVLNRDNLGGYNTTADQVLQEFNPTIGSLAWNQTAGGLWGMPAYWNGNLYLWPSHDSGYNLQQYKFTNGLLATTPYASAIPTDPQLQGASPSVSANGTNNGIVWVADTGNSLGGSPQAFYALDATNVANTLWSSTTNPADNAGIEQHFVFPTIADGRVFLTSTLNNGAVGNLLVYGLLNFAMNVPSALSISPGNNNIATIGLTSSNGFTQNVNFTASGLPAGVTVLFTPQANGSMWAVFTAAATASSGTANVTIQATRGTNKQTGALALTVGGAPDFLLSATPVTALIGSTGSSTVTARPQNGFTGVPTYSIVSAPVGATVTLTGCSATGCTLLATPSGALTLGSYPITINASWGSLNHLVTTTLIVSRTGYVDVDLSKFYNVYALASDGTPPQKRGIDGNGYALSNTLLAGSITSNGTTFRLGPPDVLDAVTGGTIPLPAGNYASLQVLSSGGITGTLPLVITYTDGSSSGGSGYSSDWGSTFCYGAEFLAATEAYRVTPNGSTQAGPWYVDGNVVAVNPNKTAASVTLPNNGVVVLAMALSYSSAVQQTIMFSPTTAQQAGSSLNLMATATSGLPVNYASSTPGFCTVSGITVSAIAAGTCTVKASQAGNSTYAPAAPVSQSFTVTPLYQAAVNLSSTYNIYGIINSGKAPLNGGFDGASYAFPGNLLGTSIAWAGSQFTLGAAAAKDAVSSVKVSLPAGSFSSLQLLASGAFGSQANQAFVLTYSDGTTSTVTQSISDWGSSSGFAGETVALSSAYRVTPSGTTQNGPWFVYGYSLPVNPSKTLSSITLPNNRNVIVFAMTLSSSTPISSSTLLSSYAAAVNLSRSSNVYALSIPGTPALNGGFDNAGYAFPSSLLPNPFSWSGSSFTFGSPGVADAVSSINVPLPLGSFASLQVLASGAFGAQTNQPFVLTYSDGTTTTLTQSVSDWGYPASYTGEATEISAAYRVAPDGSQQAGPWFVYGYSFAVNSAKTLSSITLPNDRSVIVFAMTLSSNSSIKVTHP